LHSNPPDYFAISSSFVSVCAFTAYIRSLPQPRLSSIGKDQSFFALALWEAAKKCGVNDKYRSDDMRNSRK
jgi:hypothetical protein